MKHPCSEDIFRHSRSARALMMALCVGLGACTSPGDKQTDKLIYAAGRPVYGTQAGKDVAASLWEAGEYGYVRIVQAESPAQGPNDHPVTMTREHIKTILEQFRIDRDDDDSRPLFSEQELERLAKPLADALAQAGPNQDIIFMVADREGGVLSSMVSPLLATTGRVFYRNGDLNIIFGTLEKPFESQMRAAGVMPKLNPGYRDDPANIQRDIILGSAMQYASSGRRDWVQIDSQTLAMAPGRTTTPPRQSITTTPPSTVKPSTSSYGPGPVSSSPAYQSEEYYRQAEIRLRGLKRLRDQNLISEEEYQEKRRAIIEAL